MADHLYIVLRNPCRYLIPLLAGRLIFRSKTEKDIFISKYSKSEANVCGLSQQDGVMSLTISVGDKELKLKCLSIRHMRSTDINKVMNNFWRILKGKKLKFTLKEEFIYSTDGYALSSIYITD
nr:hypothetical protein [Abalone asfa-like virus]